MEESKKDGNTAPIIRRIHFLTPAILQGIAWPLGRLALDFFCRLSIEGRENIDQALKLSREQGTGVIFAVNHTHELDFSFPLVAIPPFSPLFPMFYVTHSRDRYAATKGLGWRRYIYGFPAFLKSWGAHPYVAGQRDYTKSMPHHEHLLRCGKSVCIFPEGKIRAEDTERRVHGGVSYLAEATQSIIIPITVSGTNGMRFSEFILRKRSIVIHYGDPLSPKEVVDSNLPIPRRYQEAAKKIIKMS